MEPFDPNAASAPGSGIFGLPHGPDEAQVILVPVPWEATVSYGGGTVRGPATILEASRQVDLFDPEWGSAHEAGISMLDESDTVALWNRQARVQARRVVAVAGRIEGERLERAVGKVNELSVQLNDWVRQTVSGVLDRGKIAGVVGGEHSVSLGAIEAAAGLHPGLGVLHVDAHCDLRPGFEGFVFSHASVMHNVLERVPGVARLVQVGVRDLCEQEWKAARSDDRVRLHVDAGLHDRLLAGETWARLSDEILSDLPSEVYISFDIDGLDPSLCPHTGTPVPGGLSFAQVSLLLTRLVRSGRRIVGFDLVEVAPGPAGDEWDGNVGARLLYKLCLLSLASRKER